MARMTKSDIPKHAPLKFLCMMRMFVLGFEFYKQVMRVHGHTTPPMASGPNSPKSGPCGGDPGETCATGYHGRMKLMILNPGVSGNDESAAPLYEHFFHLDVHRCNESGYESQCDCGFVTRTIMVADITDCRLCVKQRECQRKRGNGLCN